MLLLIEQDNILAMYVLIILPFFKDLLQKKFKNKLSLFGSMNSFIKNDNNSFGIEFSYILVLL